MKVIYNKILPPSGYSAITIGPFIFTRRKSLDEKTITHESIHWEQEKELGIIGFYILYVLEFFVRLLINNFDWHTSYREISFEKEAYQGENIPGYLETRKHYAWLKSL